MIYINPQKGFDDETTRLTEIQIENNLNYWKPEDIILVTNFPFEYKGVNSIVVPDNLFCECDAKASKINTIIYLLEQHIINDITWFHDLEAFQAAPFNIVLKYDLGLTDYGWKAKWNTGSFFFKPSAIDLFRLLKKHIYKYRGNEEPILWTLTKENTHNINSRIQKLNITYNLGKRNIDYNLSIADKPVKVFHFHPYLNNLYEDFKSLLPENLSRLIYARMPNLPEAIVDLVNIEIVNKYRIWKPFMQKYDCQRICEIGISNGTNFNLMIEHKPRHAVAIDSWVDDGVISRNDSGLSQKELDKQYLDFKKSMANKPFVNIFREYSVIAAKHIPDEYFDLVYIDADHSYDGCLSDLQSWFPKIKKNRFLLGDDFRAGYARPTKVKFEVIEAVTKFAEENKLEIYEIPRYGWAIIK